VRLDHVGIVVDDLEQAKHFLAEILGLEMTNEVAIESAKLRAAYFRCGEVEIELLELGDSAARQARLGIGVKANIEHIAVQVDALDSVLAMINQRGVETTPPQPILGGLGVWTDPATSNGIRFQIIEKEVAGAS
jgi:methylmalonyl-CoA/ethylmalonyl-CoA epimerase